jgi:hypothetical protein
MQSAFLNLLGVPSLWAATEFAGAAGWLIGWKPSDPFIVLELRALGAFGI